jgi:hypothetical protein
MGLKRGDFGLYDNGVSRMGCVCVDFWELVFFAFFLRLSDDRSILPFFIFSAYSSFASFFLEMKMM